MLYRPLHRIASPVRADKGPRTSMAVFFQLVLATAMTLGVNDRVPAQSVPPPGGGVSSSPTQSASPPTQTAPSSSHTTISSIELIDRLGKVETTLKEMKPDRFQTTIIPLLSVVLGGLIVGVGNYWVQKRRLSHETEAQKTRIAAERDLAREKAVLEAARALRDWRTKQLEQLYGPLRALLGHSKGVYDQMCLQLQKREGTSKYRHITDEKSTSGQSFQIYDSGSWGSFRLLDRLPSVYKQELGVVQLIDEILSIGAQIVDTIRKNAGLALPEQEELSKTFSEYLAHYAVMKELYESAKQGRPTQEYTVGYYPRQMNKLVDKGFEIVIHDISKWDTEISGRAAQVFRDSGKGNNATT